MDGAGEILASRGAKKFVHFHTDHWEPFTGNWLKWGDESEENSNSILRFMEETAENPFFDRMTLFYNHPLRTVTNLSPIDGSGELIQFEPQRPKGWERYVYAIRKCAQETNHEFQVHIHHEGVTSGDFFKFSHLEWPKGNTTPDLDSSRLDAMICMSLEELRRITGQDFLNWHFIHGLWALNASDCAVCNVSDEIEILMKHGCVGDFSMPAGRRIVDSKIKFPHTVLPTNRPKGYDLPEAEPRKIGEKQGSAKRFLIWNQDIPFTHCTIDHYGSKLIERALDDVQGTTETWAQGSPIIGEVAFLKTHAHSMNRIYWADGADRTYSSPKVLAIFDSMKESCERAGLDYEKWTVSEVMDHLYECDSNLSNVLERQHTIPTITSISNRKILKICRDRLEALGTKESGLYEYYEARVNQKEIFDKMDLEFINFVIRNYEKRDRVHEFAAGCGQISFTMEMLGFESLEYSENNRGRMELGNEIKSKLNSDVKINFGDFRKLDLSEFDLIFSINAVTQNLGVGEYEIFAEAIKNGTDLILCHGKYGKDNKIFEKLELDEGIISEDITEREKKTDVGLVKYTRAD